MVIGQMSASWRHTAGDQRRRQCHAVKRPVIPTCGRIPQCASRIGCLVSGEEKGMKMTSVRKSAGRGGRETEREREREGVKERSWGGRQKGTLFLWSGRQYVMSWNVCGWRLMLVQIQWYLEIEHTATNKCKKFSISCYFLCYFVLFSQINVKK